MLSENDIKVLKAISDGYSDPQSISDLTGIKVESVRKSANTLSEQGLIKITEMTTEIVYLTEEGLKYAKEGLPERNLLSVIRDGVPLKSILKDPNFKIGIGHLKKKGWVEIKDGIIKPIGTAPKGADEKILEILLRVNNPTFLPQNISP
jgi:phenylalanyl-tRNA synthetase alpha chain